MNYEVIKSDDKSVTVRIKGRIEQSESDYLKKLVEGLTANGAVSLTFDLGECNAITSYGALMLYQLKDKLSKKNISLELTKVREEVENVLSLMKLL